MLWPCFPANFPFKIHNGSKLFLYSKGTAGGWAGGVFVGGGGGVCFDRGGEEGGETGWKKSPDFRSPEVGTSGEAPTKKKNKKKKLVLICTLFLP